MMRPFWNPLIKGFHLAALWGFKYKFEKMNDIPNLKKNPDNFQFYT